MGGRVADLCWFPSDHKSYAVGYATGGLWVTRNLGTTFSPLFDREVTSSIGSVLVCDAPADWKGWTDDEKKGKSKKELAEAGKAKIFWVGTGEGNGRNSSSWGNGVYRSTDSGKTWTCMGLEDSHDIPRMAVHPTDPDTLYVAALGHLWGANATRGVYKTTDGGKSWERVLFIDDDTGCVDVILHPSQADVVYAAMYARRRTPHGFTSGGPEGGIYRSTDAGRTWQKLGGGLPATTGRIGLDIFLANPKVIYAVVESNEGGGPSIRDDRYREGGIFRSDDGGDTWTRLSVRSPRAFYFSKIKVDPKDDQRVYLLGWTTEVSDDGGRTFRQGFADKLHADHHAMLIDPNDTANLVIGTDGGVNPSFDRGATWQFLNTMAVGQFYNVAVDLSHPYRVMGGLQDNGSWLGPSATNRNVKDEHEGGEPDTGITNADWTFVLGGDGFHCDFDPTDSDWVYAEWQGGNLNRINLRTGERLFIAPEAREGQPRFRFNWNTPFFVSKHDPTVLYMGGNYVFRLRDRGARWERISDDLTTRDIAKVETVGSHAETHGTVVTLAESELDANVLWAGTDDGLIWVTRDGGKTWTNVTPKEVNGWYVSRVEASHHEPGRAYASIDGHRSDMMDPLILATDDYGQTWRDVTGDLPKGRSVKVVREDRTAPNVLYAGTEQGFYLSVNRGTTWLRAHGKALPTTPVDDIVQHPLELDLILGTHGRSIWILDGDPLRFLTPETTAQEVALFDPLPATPRMRLHYNGLWTDQVFRGQNPPIGAQIDYWLAEFPNDEVSIKVFDAKDREIRKLAGGTAQGLNRVVWDLQPKESMRLPDQGQEPSAPFFVPPGRYRLELWVGDAKKAVASAEVLAFT